MMSNAAWLVLILLALGIYFLIAACVVRTFRYKFGSFQVPRLVGGIIYALIGTVLVWIAIALALRP